LRRAAGAFDPPGAAAAAHDEIGVTIGAYQGNGGVSGITVGDL
jgi:hypothetical protein